MKKPIFYLLLFSFIFANTTNSHQEELAIKNELCGCLKNNYSLTQIHSRLTNPQHINSLNPLSPDNQFSLNLSAGPTTSNNWSGYQVYTKKKYSVDEVSGSWIVPNIQPSSESTYSSSWVGISGGGSIQQIGTYQNFIVNSDGTTETQYEAWFEMYPDIAFTINNFPVAPNDKITAKVKWLRDVNNRSHFSLSIKNETQKAKPFKVKRTQKKSIVQRTEAEWILEASGVKGGTANLANYGMMSFNSCKVTMNGKKGTINNKLWKHIAITMINSTGEVISRPSQLQDKGSAFILTQPSQNN